MKIRLIHSVVVGWGVCMSFMAAGCRPAVEPAALFEPNYLYAHALEIKEEINLDQPLSDSQALMTEWFGTLDEPKLPPLFAEDDYKELLSLSKIEKADCIMLGGGAILRCVAIKMLHMQVIQSIEGEFWFKLLYLIICVWASYNF